MDLREKIEKCDLKYNQFKAKLDENPVMNFIFGNYSVLKKYHDMELMEIMQGY